MAEAPDEERRITEPKADSNKVRIAEAEVQSSSTIPGEFIYDFTRLKEYAR